MINVIDLDRAPEPESGLADGVGGLARPCGPLIAIGTTAQSLQSPDAGYWLERATVTLVREPHSDRRVVSVPAPADTATDIAGRCRHRPQSAAICDDVLRSVDPHAPAGAGLITESLAYSALQAGPEFRGWLTGRQPAIVRKDPDQVEVTRQGNTVTLRLNQPGRHNAFSTAMRAELLDGLSVACLDDTVDEVVLSGAGPSFCSGGDLSEFGGFTDVAAAHLARTRHSPALALDSLTRRLGRRCRADIHGQVLGSGLEMAAFCGWVRAHPDTVLGLPELDLGLIPGAGGTVSVTRRIGRWRTAYLILSGRTIDAPTALRWGLIDEIAR